MSLFDKEQQKDEVSGADVDITDSNDTVTDASPDTAEGERTQIIETPEPENKDKNEKKPPKRRLQVSVFVAVIAMLMASVLTCQITYLTVKQSYNRKLAQVQTGLFGSGKLAELDELYRAYFIGEIDENELVDGLIEGYIYGVGDKYGNYMSAEEYQSYVNSLNSKTDGIGVSATWNSDYKAIEVLYVYENSPAAAVGMLEGDLIISVDGKDVATEGYDMSISNIKGVKGTDVIITVRRGDDYSDEKQFTITRSTIEIQTVRYYALDNIAIISISNFYEDTPNELKAVIETAKAEGCDRIIFDVRNNSGGLLTSIEEVLDYLLPEGVVVRMKDAAGNWTSFSSDATCITMPMTVLVNKNTASAAELFTSALMDFNYADVIGTQTYGKGTVTRPYYLSDGSVIYMSYQLYYPPVSDNFEGKGIVPDIVLELSEEAQKINFYKLTYEDDNQLQKAVEVIKQK